MATMSGDKRLSFSRYFGIKKSALDKEGFFDISLIADLPLFIDPFHLFYSEKEEYQKLHNGIIKYLAFLRDYSIAHGGEEPTKGIIEAYYKFPEVKQNWFGFTFMGNGGRGLGRQFALALNDNFYGLFKDLEGTAATPRHLEKLTLIADRVGKDAISDFTTNLIHGYLATKTEAFAKKHIAKSRLRSFTIKKAEFDYKHKVWVPKSFVLPAYNEDYVLLTPKDLLTKDDTWINKTDIVEGFSEIPSAAPNDALREQLVNYFNQKLQEHAVKKIDKRSNKVVRRVVKESRIKAARDTIQEFPITLDIYVDLKEQRGKQALTKGAALVEATDKFYQGPFINFANQFAAPQGMPTSYDEAHERATHFKKCVELKDGYKNMYENGEPVGEDWVQRMFWFVWGGSESQLDRDPDNGLGKPDFVASQGRKDKTLIEFKLARSSSLEKNLLKQLETYKKSNETKKGIWVIIFFTSEEEQKTLDILKKHKLQDNPDYILVDARKDNKTTGSRVK